MNDIKQVNPVRRLTEEAVTLTVDLFAPRGFDLPGLDRWLTEALEIDPADFLATSGERHRGESSHARDFLTRVLALSRLLFQVGRLPLFDLPDIVSLEQHDADAQKYRARVSFALIDLIPIFCYQLVLRIALESCIWAAQTPFTDENRRKFYGTIEEKAIKPLHRRVRSGKSTIPVLRVAHLLGIPFIHLGLGIYQLGWGSKARRMDRSTTELDSAMGSVLSQNKVATASLLRMAGLPAPVHAVVGNEANALASAKKIGFPVVVKPTDRDRGEGVTVDITDEANLRAAFESARKIARNKQVIVERQVTGVCHRLFIANGKLLYAVKRLPMSVTGDGRHTIADLVDREVSNQERKPPWIRSEIRPIDELALVALEQAGFAPDSVLETGVLAPLRRIESTEWGGVDEEVSDQIHPENLYVAIRAAELFGLHVAGIDIITDDISMPWHESGAIVNEVNFAPLLGGGDISRRHIPVFLSEFVQGDGKIPVEVFAEDEIAARNRRDELIRQELRCYLITGSGAIDPQGIVVKFPFNSLKRMVRALICRADVDAIVIATGTEQLQQ